MSRDEKFPVTSGEVAAYCAEIPLTEEEIAAFHRAGTLPPVSPFVPHERERLTIKPQLPKPGPANLDPEKWATLPRAERRALWRHHRRITKE